VKIDGHCHCGEIAFEAEVDPNALTICHCRHAFCGNCGTPIYACAVDNPQVYALRVGTITQRAAFKPQRQGWRRSALAWVNALAAVPASEKGWS